MKWGEQFPEPPRPLEPPPAGDRRRADQPRGVDVVPQSHRRRAMPGRRHLVADRDRRDHDRSSPGAIPTVPGSATRPLPGIVPAIVTKDGTPVGPGKGGFLIIKKPWPSMLRTIYGDDARYQEQYWSEIPGAYFTGDGARCDEQEDYWILGRVDDVLNVAGHRLSTMEVESALVSHPKVAEAAVVGKPDELRGQAIAAFVTLESGQSPSEELRRNCAPMSSRRSAHWRGPTISGSRRPCPRRAAARSCAGCSATSPPAARAPATPRRWKT